MAASSRDLRSHVTDVVTCPICLELFNNPKSLPCLHTFCLKCIEGNCRGNEPGDEVACTVCRQKFSIPESGVQGLVGNFFIAGLVEARQIANDVVVQVPCEVCSDDSDCDDSSVAVSTMYCVDCNQKLCEQCSKPHKKWRGGPHKVVRIGTEVEAELIQMHRGKCDKHRTDDVRFYCFDCKTNICLMCFAEEHQQHECKNVDTVAAECCKQIDADIGTIKERATAARNEISRLEEERRKFLANVEEVGEEIMRRGEELKQLIDKQVNELMAEMQVLKTEKCKEIESHKVSFETKLAAFETFSTYCSELKSKGNPCDVTRATHDLHIRATELLQNDVTLTYYCAPVVTFKPMNIHEIFPDGQNFVGNVTDTDMRVARVIHTLPEAEAVCGVALLDDKLYVLRYKAKDDIEVYKTTTTTTTTTPLYSFLHHLSLPEMKSLVYMTSCKQCRCLYISDDDIGCVHRITLNGKVQKLSLKYKPWGLSVTSQSNVIVTCREDRKILELTTDGKQVREINLQSDVVHPSHAIQLPNGQFVVCHGNSSDPIHRVCIVDTNGHVTQSYGGRAGSANVGHLDGPRHLAVDKDEFIVVVDYNNRRVLLLSPTLSFVREIVSRDQFLWNPVRLFLDVDGRRLYVADNNRKERTLTAGRVVVVQM